MRPTPEIVDGQRQRVLKIDAHFWKTKIVLAHRTLLNREGVQLADVACRHPSGRGAPGEQKACHTVVFVRRGCFTRVADGTVATLDPTLAYCIQPGEEQRYDHPHDLGDDCTALTLTPELLASLNGGEPALPRTPVQVSPQLTSCTARCLPTADEQATRTSSLSEPYS